MLDIHEFGCWQAGCSSCQEGRAEVVPDLLTGDAATQQIISAHPMLAWKAQNVREHKEATSRPKRERE